MSYKSIGMVTELEDLMGRCQVAAERKLGQSADPLGNTVRMLGLPEPAAATNQEFSRLVPLYLSLLKDIRENGDKSIYLRPLQDSTRDEPEAAAVLLYLIEFPALVRCSRGDMSGMAKCSVTEAFEHADIANEIAKNPVIGGWCREALRNHGQHHFLVLGSCINILMSVPRLPKNQAKKTIKRVVFRGAKDLQTGFEELRADLARTVSRDDILSDAVFNSLQLQICILQTLYGDKTAQEMLPSITSYQKEFEEALERHRHAVPPAQYQLFRTLLGVPMTVQETFLGLEGLQNKKTANSEVAVCNRQGCTNPGKSRCASCKLVSYCSKDCQVADWKAGHKKICKGKKATTSKKEQKIGAATDAARQTVSPALLQQDARLAQYPNLDYVVVMPTGDEDEGVSFSAMGSVVFKVFRSKAPTSPVAVNRMYEMLAENNPDLRDIVRKQLQAEYGVDPLSAEAMMDPSRGGDMSEEEIMRQLQNL